MKISRHRRQFHLATGAVAIVLMTASVFGRAGAEAQTYPTRPVTLVVPFPAGGPNDVTLRALAGAAEHHLGQPIVIENKAGGSGTLGPAQVAATAKPDGYTIVEILPIALRAPFLRKTSYDPSRDFTYIIGVSGQTMGIVVRSDAPWKTFQEFLAEAKTAPGKINFGTSGAGGNPHVTMLKIGQQENIKWTHVPYKGNAELVNALLGGHIDAVADGSGWAPQVDAGQFKLLVTFGDARTKNWPDVPTLKESGIEWAVNAPYGLAGPRGMDPKIVKVLHDAFQKGMEAPSFAKTMAQLNQELFYLNTEDYRAFVMKQIEVEKRLVKEFGLKED
jgi:tripartite-type tricarboxylate transporter receptor subunit TctC